MNSYLLTNTIVYQGKWRGAFVAVKVLIPGNLDLQELEAEAAVMK